MPHELHVYVAMSISNQLLVLILSFLNQKCDLIQIFL
jgi:hypothetical protein